MILFCTSQHSSYDTFLHVMTRICTVHFCSQWQESALYFLVVTTKICTVISCTRQQKIAWYFFVMRTKNCTVIFCTAVQKIAPRSAPGPQTCRGCPPRDPSLARRHGAPDLGLTGTNRTMAPRPATRTCPPARLPRHLGWRGCRLRPPRHPGK